MERISAFVAVKSTVDLTKIDFNTFLYLYQNQLTAAHLDKNQVKQALQEAKEIYQVFYGAGLRPQAVLHVPRAPGSTPPRSP